MIKQIVISIAIVIGLINISTAQEETSKPTFFYGFNIYLEARPLLFAQKESDYFPSYIKVDQELSFALGCPIGVRFNDQWEVFSAVNYLYQRATYRASGLLTPSDFNLTPGRPITSSLSFEITKIFHQVNIPVLVAFGKTFKNDRISISAGPEFDLFFAQKTSGIITEGGLTRAPENLSIAGKRVQMLWRISLTYHKRINEKMYLGISPSVSLHLRKTFSNFYTTSMSIPSASNKIGLSVFLLFEK